MYICMYSVQTKEVQEELALDMKLLEQMLQETSNEAMLQLQKKVKKQNTPPPPQYFLYIHTII